MSGDPVPYVVMFGLAGIFSLLMLLQRRFVGLGVIWAMIGSGVLIDGFIGDALVGFGAILLPLSSVGVTRGQIFSGSPRHKTHGKDPSLFRDDVHQALEAPSHEPVDDVKMDSVELTHPFWGPD